MKRIILIGNGFDLAHGMKTSYQNFIDDFWLNHSEQIKNEINLTYNSGVHTYKTENFELNYTKESPYQYTFKSYKNIVDDNAGIIPVFKNMFLKNICDKYYIQNWVDIENEYYLMLKNLVKHHNANNYDINKLNTDFKFIQDSLKKYLIEVEKNHKIESINQIRIQRDIENKIFENFYLKDFTEEILNKVAQHEFERFSHTITLLKQNRALISDMSEEDQLIVSYLKDFGNEKQLSEIKRHLMDDKLSKNYNLKPEEILFLNFNYTSTEQFYSNSFNNPLNVHTETIHIHGELDASINRDIIFGYGDEMDEDYKEIEKLNENEYLTYVKSMRYLENENYKNLLNFINSDNYQVFIFGHSCGNSDRTLLNTLFEHKNCCSIKPFYHLKANGEDNFTEIIKNISRNFNSKAKMRDVVVNKEYCKPLVSI